MGQTDGQTDGRRTVTESLPHTMLAIPEVLECSYSAAIGKKGTGSPYSITERMVPKLIPVLGSQPAGGVSHKPGGRLPLLSARLQLPSQPLKGLLPISLLGEQRHDGCEQFAQDCYPRASRLRFEPGPLCARVQYADHSATGPSCCNRAAEYCNERVRVSLCFYVCPRTYQALSDAFEFIGAI